MVSNFDFWLQLARVGDLPGCIVSSSTPNRDSVSCVMTTRVTIIRQERKTPKGNNDQQMQSNKREINHPVFLQISTVPVPPED